jgi:anti-sigma factor RsiW
MRCEKIQELLLTDYMDGRLIGSVNEQVEAHLGKCVACQEFWSGAKATLAEPFAKLALERMPEALRNSIREQVQEEKIRSERNYWEAAKEWLRSGFLFPVPAKAWVAMAVCLLMITTSFVAIGSRQAKQQERIIFLAEIADWSGTQAQGSASYGTEVETYFL